MDRKGQGAMEYLTTYGWAILVVIVIGIAFWRLGIFEIGSSQPPTSTGFTTIKPLLATCFMSGATSNCPNPNLACPCFGGGFANNCSGIFRCTFVNAAGAPIRLIDIDVETDIGPCRDDVGGKLSFAKISLGGNFDNTNDRGYGLFRPDTDLLQGHAPPAAQMPDPNYELWVETDGVFGIHVPHCPPYAYQPACPNTGAPGEVGDIYDVEVSVLYEIDLGEVTARRRVTGHVKGSREQWPNLICPCGIRGT